MSRNLIPSYPPPFLALSIIYTVAIRENLSNLCNFVKLSFISPLIMDLLKTYCFSIEMEVRDYELDCEQIVNNANYLHYLEHTRHKFCRAAGMPFIEMHEKGIDAVVRKLEMEYYSPLRSGDSFLSCLNIERKGPRFIFHQDIYKKPEGKAETFGEPVVKAVVTIVALKDGKLSKGDEIAEFFKKYLD